MQSNIFTIAARAQSAGFTLIELLIVVFILGITASLAGANLFGLTQDQRIESASSTLANQLKYTQSEAIRSSSSMKICIANTHPPTACNTALSANWSQGWIIFQDSDGDNVIDNDERQLNIQHPLNKIIVTTENDGGTDMNIKSIEFSSLGASSYAGNILFKDSGNSQPPVKLILLESGQVISVSS